jgi:hypothetical protein
MRGSSGRSGSHAALDPTATMQASNETVCSPSPPSTRRRFGPVHDLDLPASGELAEAARQPLDDRLLPRAHRVDVELGGGVGHAVGRGLRGLGHHLGHVEQGLGRDAADVEADAAEHRVTLDQDRLLPQVGGAEGGRVAARPGAEHEDLGVVVGVGRRRGGRGLGGLRRGRRLAGVVGRRAVRCGAVEHEQQRALGHGVPHADLELADHAGKRRRHVHRRLVGLERDERILGRDLIPGLDQHLDDRHVGEVPDVGDLDLAGLAHRSTRRKSERTLTRKAQKRAAAAPSTTRWS